MCTSGGGEGDLDCDQKEEEESEAPAADSGHDGAWRCCGVHTAARCIYIHLHNMWRTVRKISTIPEHDPACGARVFLGQL